MNESESDELLENIRRIRSASGCSIVVVDHDLRLIMQRCERIQVLDQGRTIAIGEERSVRIVVSLIVFCVALTLGSPEFQKR